MQEQRFLLITSFLLILIGAPAVYSVVREPVTKLTPEETQLQSLQSPSQERSPASVESNPHHNSIQSKSVVLNYECENQNLPEVDANLLRLRGPTSSHCIDEKWKDISVINHSNGFTASVIFIKNKGFTTDFIEINEGSNELEIKATDDKGRAVTQKMTVKRRLPASAEISN